MYLGVEDGGVFACSRVLWLALPGLVLLALRRGFRAEAALCATMIVAYLTFNACYGDSIVFWGGGASVGPRHLIPVLPFVAIPLCVGLRPLKVLFYPLVMISVFYMLLATAVEIASAPLLHLDLPGPGRWLDWRGYFRRLGLGSAIARPSGTAFNNYPLLMQAAVAGQGVALGWRPLVDDQIERGLLVPVGPEIRDHSRGYELILDPARARDATTVARSWLLEAFAKDGENHP